MDLLTGTLQTPRRLVFADYQFQMSWIYLERSRRSAKEMPAFKKCKRSQQGNLTAAALLCTVFSAVLRCVCVRACVLECFCVTSQSPLLKHKGPAALSCWGQVLWRADFGCTVALFSRRAAELYLQIGQRSAQPLCQLAFSFPFFFFNVREKADLDPVLLPRPVHPSVRLSGGLSVCLPACHSISRRTSLFPRLLQFIRCFLPPSLCAAHLVCLYRSSRHPSPGSSRPVLLTAPPIPRRSGANSPVRQVAIGYPKNRYKSSDDVIIS